MPHIDIHPDTYTYTLILRATGPSNAITTNLGEGPVASHVNKVRGPRALGALSSLMLSGPLILSPTCVPAVVGHMTERPCKFSDIR